MPDPQAPGAERLTAAAIVEDIRLGRRSVREVAEETLARIALHEPALRAFVHLDPAQVRAGAAALDARPGAGALRGVTVAVKDQFATRDMPTTYAAPRYRGMRPGADAAAVDILRGLGALVVGKTTLPELVASGVGPVTANPAAPGHTPGGSSSGSAAAVAAGLCAVGLGTQTGGSVIRPASFCGIFGLKPTWNAICLEGARILAPSADTVGFFTRSAGDLWLLADAFGLDAAPRPDGPAGLRVGLCRTPMWPLVEPPMRAALEEAGRQLAAAGARVEDLDLPADPFAGLHKAGRAILSREMRAAFLNEALNTPRPGPAILRHIAEGEQVGPEEARTAYALADRCRAGIDGILADFDFVLAPSAAGEPPRGLTSTGSSAVNLIWSILQVPVVNVPGLKGPSGAPLGISVVARRYADRTAIAGAALLAPLLAAA